MSSNDTSNAPVDVRGPRFAAWVTTAVLIGVLTVFAFVPFALMFIFSLKLSVIIKFFSTD